MELNKKDIDVAIGALSVRYAVISRMKKGDVEVDAVKTALTCLEEYPKLQAEVEELKKKLSEYEGDKNAKV